MGSPETETIYVDVVNETNEHYIVDAYLGKNITIAKSMLENDVAVAQHLDNIGAIGIEMELPEWFLNKYGLI